MRFTISVESDSAAMEDDPADEVRYLLAQVSSFVEGGFDIGALRDSNGNLVGYYRKEG